MTAPTLTIREQADQLIRLWCDALNSGDANRALAAALSLQRCSLKRITKIVNGADPTAQVEKHIAGIAVDFDLASEWFDDRKRLFSIAAEFYPSTDPKVLAIDLLEQLDFAELVLANHPQLGPTTRRVERAKQSIADAPADFFSADEWILAMRDTFESNRSELAFEVLNSTTKFGRLCRIIKEDALWREQPALANTNVQSLYVLESSPELWSSFKDVQEFETAADGADRNAPTLCSQTWSSELMDARVTLPVKRGKSTKITVWFTFAEDPAAEVVVTLFGQHATVAKNKKGNYFAEFDYPTDSKLPDFKIDPDAKQVDAASFNREV